MTVCIYRYIHTTALYYYHIGNQSLFIVMRKYELFVTLTLIVNTITVAVKVLRIQNNIPECFSQYR